MRKNRVLYLCIGISLVVALVMALDWLPFLRGGEIFNWQWSYHPAPFMRIAAFALVVIIYSAVALALMTTHRHRWLPVWAAAGVIVLTLAAIWVRADNPLLELYHRTVSLTATGPYSASALIDWSTTDWLDWTTIMADFRPLSQHVALSPPLLPMIHRGVTQAVDAVAPLEHTLQRVLLPHQCHNYTVLSFTAAEQGGAIFGILMPVWAALSVFPLAAVQKYLHPDESPWLCALLPLTPALVLFGGSWNTVYPLFALIAFGLLLVGSDDRLHIGWLLLSGCIVGLLTFANFSVVPLGLFAGLYVLLRYIVRERADYSLLRPVKIGSIFGAGVMLPWLIWMAAGGSSPFAMLETAFAVHLGLERPYLPWIWMHAWEWILLGSVPAAILWLAAVPFDRKRTSGYSLALALLAAIGIMLLSHTARGETGRVWLFFVPFLLLAAGNWRLSLWDKAGVFVAQAAILIALVGTWQVMEAPDISAPPSAPAPSDALIPVDIEFEPGFTLVGWQGRQQDNTIQLDLAWRATEFISTPYYFAALPVAPDGNPGESVVWQPQQTNYPTTCWYGSGIIGDRIVLPLPDDAAPGGWYISLTAFAEVTNSGATVPVRLPDGSQDRQVGLGPVIISR